MGTCSEASVDWFLWGYPGAMGTVSLAPAMNRINGYMVPLRGIRLLPERADHNQIIPFSSKENDTVYFLIFTVFFLLHCE